MFRRNQFLKVSHRDRDARLGHLRVSLRKHALLEAVRAAAKAIVLIENPDHPEYEKGADHFNAFATALGSDEKVDINTFRRFVIGETNQPRAIDLAALALCLLELATEHANDARVTGLLFGPEGARRPLFSAIAEFVLNGDHDKLTAVEGDGALAAQSIANSDLTGAFPTMIEILKGKNPTVEDVWSHFGGAYSKGRQPRQMSFITYRYSTTGGNILKGFLVLKHHPATGIGHFRFSHFIWGGPQNSDIFRETHGLMMACDKAYYFLGYGQTISGNKRDGEYRKGREYRELRLRPDVQTFDLMTVEFDEFNLRNVVLSGLTMGSAALYQPVVSRLALLCLGTDKELDRELFDDEIIPNELGATDMEADLRDTFRRLVDIGVAGFDRRLEYRKSAKEIEPRVVTRCKERILKIIDNTPHWETSGENPLRIQNPRNAGAIESEGEGRPRK